jgi:hypothetical protein
MWWLGRRITLVAAVFLGVVTPVQAQEEMTVEALKAQHQIALLAHDVALQEFALLDTQLDDALVVFDSARAAGDDERLSEVFIYINQINDRLDSQERRVTETAQDVKDWRERLLGALRVRWDELLARADTTQNQTDRQNLNNSIQDTKNQVADLRAEDEPVVTLDPVNDIVIRPSDSRAQILSKASFLEVHAEINERQLEYNARLLEDLRREQTLQRRSADFRNDVERWGDTRLPVGAPGRRTGEDPDPAQRRVGADSLGAAPTYLTYEERVASLEALQVRLLARIEEIRAKAALFRREAGGEWA